jgi:hypothetical protein
MSKKRTKEYTRDEWEEKVRKAGVPKLPRRNRLGYVPSLRSVCFPGKRYYNSDLREFFSFDNS